MKMTAGLIIRGMIAELKDTYAFLLQTGNTLFLVLTKTRPQNFQLEVQLARWCLQYIN